jgi:integrase
MNARSTMQNKVEAYLAERRREGFSMKIAGQQLSWFAQFTDATGYRGPLTIELASRWALANRSGRRLTAARRIEVLRAFARYCRSWDQRSEIPPLRLFGPGHRRLTTHIYRDTEIRALMRAARALHPAGRLRAETCATIIGLMASSGLRISEVTGLHRQDVDLETGCLHIRHGKFGKARELPLDPTTTAALRAYTRERDRRLPHPRSPSFLLSRAGTRLHYKNVHGTFRRLVHRARLAVGRRPRPRLHDLRHTFAVTTLVRWYRAGVDVEVRLPALSTYLGHVAPSSTYWYLTATPELLQLAHRRAQHVHKARP